MNCLRIVITVLALASLVGCRLEIVVPKGGRVTTESGNFACPTGDVCVIDIFDDQFDETFIVELQIGYQFVGWERGRSHLCAGSKATCRFSTSFFGASEALMDLLQEDTTVYLKPGIVRVPNPNFSALTLRMQKFVSESGFDGASIIIVDKRLGTIYEQAFGTFTKDTVVLLASTSKMPSASLLMALDRRGQFDFDIEAPIARYLPYEGYYGDVTAEQLLSNTSGIPGIDYTADYGPHLCQFNAKGNLEDCGKEIYQYLLPGVEPPGTAYSYGGSQWQLAGALAEQVGKASWAELFNRFIGKPCDLEVFEYGNMLAPENIVRWNGDRASLIGQDNPNIGAGAISNLQDYGKLLLMHLNDGWCGPKRVLAWDAPAYMRIDRKQPVLPFEPGYGMGWWMHRKNVGEPRIYFDPGAFGTHAWIDIGLGYGAVFLVEDLSQTITDQSWDFVHGELIDLVGEILLRGRGI